LNNSPRAIKDLTSDHSEIHATIPNTDWSSFYLNAADEVAPVLDVDSLCLPPIAEALTVVDLYLKHFNTCLPLFDPVVLVSLVYELYQTNRKRRCPVQWAALNITLALANRYVMEGESYEKLSVEYYKRARSVLTQVMFNRAELLNVQVLVGVLMLLEGEMQLNPPLFLVATTLRLAHQIGLHAKVFSSHVEPAIAKQRARVFWLAYIMDKDLSLRGKQASVQQDDDVDLNLPTTGADDDIPLQPDREPGDIVTMDSTARINFFLSRVQLAVIEGAVYDYLYSTRAMKRTPEERETALKSVARALHQWKATVPPEFSAENAVMTTPPTALGFLGVMHATSLVCTSHIHQVFPSNDLLVSQLRHHAKIGTAPSLPADWQLLVTEATAYVSLFRTLRNMRQRDHW
jgi:hypothetical protein